MTKGTREKERPGGHYSLLLVENVCVDSGTHIETREDRGGQEHKGYHCEAGMKEGIWCI